MTKLSVNLNKVALLRNARGRDFPNVAVFASRCLELGADGITIHPRPDQRHARYADALVVECLELGLSTVLERYLSILCAADERHPSR